MAIDETTFDYLKPTEDQLARMNTLRASARLYAITLDRNLPDGPDKTYALRKFREVAMWANVALTRHADGSPRSGSDRDPEAGDYPPIHPVKGDLGSVPL